MRDMKTWTKTAGMENVARGPMESQQAAYKQNNVTIAPKCSERIVRQLTVTYETPNTRT